MPVSTSEQRLTDRQIDALKVLKRAPKTTSQVYIQLLKNNPEVSKHSIRARMRNLEDRELVRARSQYNKTLKRDVILWELTDKGRDALSKNGRSS